MTSPWTQRVTAQAVKQRLAALHRRFQGLRGRRIPPSIAMFLLGLAALAALAIWRWPEDAPLGVSNRIGEFETACIFAWNGATE